tara:strand:- start:483 stop:1139 length:657 start_codon:yes stop_codon:yes gene_type:complete
MKSEEIIQLINHPENILSDEIIKLEHLLSKHPYFQSGQLLLAKGLLNTNSIRYNQQLKKTAAYCLDRKKLFKLITLNNSNKNRTAKVAVGKSVEEELELGNPLVFETSEYHSFSQWLTLLNVKQIKRKKDEILANDFSEKNALISKAKKEMFFNAIDIAKESLIENDDLVTPTLAKVYLEQGHYEKAISAYKKLILRYPEKNSFFASQIKLIHKLNNN